MIEAIATEQQDETILQEAQKLIYGDRHESYGHPFEDFCRVGRMWGTILEREDIPPEKVGLMMIALKLCREVNLHKRDNLTDIAGYAGTVMMVHQRKAELEG